MQAIKIRRIKWLVLSCIILQGCIYEYNPELSKYEDLLVVYGIITDNYGPHEIIISRTASVYGYAGTPETKATVRISDDKGNMVALKEKGSGIYLTPTDFKGVIGENYKVLITLSNGRNYESELVKLIDAPEIKSLEYGFTTKPDSKTSEDVYGCQFYVSADGENENQKYYRWEMLETWEIRMPFFITHYWTGDSLMQISFPSRCWRHNKIEDLFIATTQEYQTNSIKKLPLNFTSIESERLAVKYRLIVNQYALTEKSYYFWKGQIENTQQQGSLYDKQPYQVIGNMKCIENPKEIVLGIFEASAVSSKQIYVLPPDEFVPTGFETCDSKELSELTEFERKRSYYASYTLMDSIIVFGKVCVDCTSTGSTPNMPDSWDESGE